MSKFEIISSSILERPKWIAKKNPTLITVKLAHYKKFQFALQN